VCVCVCDRGVHPAKTADRIWMPFGVVSGDGRRMGVLHRGGDRPKEGTILGVNLVCPIVTNGDFAA